MNNKPHHITTTTTKKTVFKTPHIKLIMINNLLLPHTASHLQSANDRPRPGQPVSSFPLCVSSHQQQYTHVIHSADLVVPDGVARSAQSFDLRQRITKLSSLDVLFWACMRFFSCLINWHSWRDTLHLRRLFADDTS